MTQGWICVHRKLLEWEWFEDHNAFRLFMYLLLKANHKPQKWKGIAIERGQHLTSLDKLSAGTGLSKSKLRTAIKKLVSTHEIAHHTNSQHTVFTVKNYNVYQSIDTPVSNQMTNESQTNDIQIATNNNVNNTNNTNNEDKVNSASPKVEACPYEQIVDIYHEVLPMVPAIAQLTSQRKTKIKNFWNKFDFTIERWTGYLKYIKSNCTWMTEARPNGNGGMWKAKNLEYFVTEKCYLSVKEDRASDQ